MSVPVRPRIASNSEGSSSNHPFKYIYMKIWHISDTHTFHGLLKVPEVDMVIFSGDATNPRDKYANQKEMLEFLDWYGTLLIGERIFVAGNHDTSIFHGLIKPKDFTDRGITYLENEEVIVNGLKIFGSPWTPTFGEGWAFNRAREKIYKIWDNISPDTDIVVTHGPPKGILDLSYNKDNDLEFCGDLSLKKRMRYIEPKLVCFGHIHNCDNIINAGYVKQSSHPTIYSNGSVVTDGRFGYLSSNGNIFEI